MIHALADTQDQSIPLLRYANSLHFFLAVRRRIALRLVEEHFANTTEAEFAEAVREDSKC